MELLESYYRGDQEYARHMMSRLSEKELQRILKDAKLHKSINVVSTKIETHGRDTTATPIYSNSEESRMPEVYDMVIYQFDVDELGRYQTLYNPQTNTSSTYCNVFAYDVTAAMGAPLPHWLMPDPENSGEYVPYEYGLVGKRAANYADALAHKAGEVDANTLFRYMEDQSEDIGYHEVTAEQAQQMANMGKPAVAIWQNTTEDDNGDDNPGHVVVLRPENPKIPLENDSKRGMYIAQAGASNFDYDAIERAFDDSEFDDVKFYYHD